MTQFPKLHELAKHCWNGACNPPGIIRSLGEAMSEIKDGNYKGNIDLKIIIGQLSYLCGESLGPSDEAVSVFVRSIVIDNADVHAAITVIRFGRTRTYRHYSFESLMRAKALIESHNPYLILTLGGMYAVSSYFYQKIKGE